MNTCYAMLREDKINKKGLAPVYIRIVVNRQSAYIATGVKVEPSKWNINKQRLRSSYTNSAAANNLIDSTISKVQEQIYEYDKQGKRYTAKQIKEIVLNENKDCVIDYATTWVQSRKDRKDIGQSTYLKYNGVIDKMRKTAGGSLRIDSLDYEFLVRHDKELRDTHNNKQNTIASNFSFIRALCNELIRDDKMKLNDYPFKKFKLKYEDSKRKYLTIEQIDSIEQMILPKDSKIKMSRDIFLFCNQTGLRIGDALLLKGKNFTGEHIIIQSQKTDTYTSVYCRPKAKEIINAYRSDPDSYVFGFLTDDKQANEVEALNEQKSATALINKNLGIIGKRCGIEDKVSTHYARHSFSSNALASGLSLEEIKGMLNHKDIRTTQIYARTLDKVKDDAFKKLG